MGKELKVRFLKGTDELKLRSDKSFGGNSLPYPYMYRDNEGEAHLRIDKSRYHWRRGDTGGAFPDVAQRNRYMDRINKACGEIVVVPEEADGGNDGQAT